LHQLHACHQRRLLIAEYGLHLYQNQQQQNVWQIQLQAAGLHIPNLLLLFFFDKAYTGYGNNIGYKFKKLFELIKITAYRSDALINNM